MVLVKMVSAYWNNLNFFDAVILICGLLMLGLQIYYCVCRKDYKVAKLEETRQGILYFCEFFPLAGLLGTMLALLVTLSSMGSGKPDIGVIFTNFAPALTSTISGLLMLMVNLVANFIFGWLNNRSEK